VLLTGAAVVGGGVPTPSEWVPRKSPSGVGAATNFRHFGISAHDLLWRGHAALFIGPSLSGFSETNHHGYAVECMSIRSALQAVAILSDESTDLAGSEGKSPSRVGEGRLR
jgi:hypothetical protein